MKKKIFALAMTAVISFSMMYTAMADTSEGLYVFFTGDAGVSMTVSTEASPIPSEGNNTGNNTGNNP